MIIEVIWGYSDFKKNLLISMIERDIWNYRKQCNKFWTNANPFYGIPFKATKRNIRVYFGKKITHYDELKDISGIIVFSIEAFVYFWWLCQLLTFFLLRRLIKDLWWYNLCLNEVLTIVRVFSVCRAQGLWQDPRFII